MTRNREPGAHRNLIGLKISDDLLTRVNGARGSVPVQDFLRGLIAAAVQDASGFPDWERRARDAERKLARITEILGKQP